MMDLTKLTNRELLDAWTGSLEELYRRGVVRTYNNPIGDIAEALVARHYGGTRAAFDNPAWDVAVGDELLQVKACRRSTPTTKLGFSPLRHREGYTAVVLVVFTAGMRVEQAWRVPREVANELSAEVPHVNGWRIGLAANVLNHPDVHRIELDDSSIDAAEPQRTPGCPTYDCNLDMANGMNPRSIDFALKLMDPRAFEDLVFALVRDEHPTAVQLTPPDAGRDTVVPGEGGGRERAWQAKHHTSGIKWDDCEMARLVSPGPMRPAEVRCRFGRSRGVPGFRPRRSAGSKAARFAVPAARPSSRSPAG